jgi:magnesium chelatase subunit I
MKTLAPKGTPPRPSDPTSIRTLAELRASGWRSRSVKEELRENFTKALAAAAREGTAASESLFPGIVGYDDTVLPEIANALLAGHDLLFLGEKGQGKSRLMRLLPRFLDEWVPYLDIAGSPVHSRRDRPRRFRSPGGIATTAMRSGLRLEPSSPT